jgi:hypothetical protein
VRLDGRGKEKHTWMTVQQRTLLPSAAAVVLMEEEREASWERKRLWAACGRGGCVAKSIGEVGPVIASPTLLASTVPVEQYRSIVSTYYHSGVFGSLVPSVPLPEGKYIGALEILDLFEWA